jgi:hypothetical protein
VPSVFRGAEVPAVLIGVFMVDLMVGIYPVRSEYPLRCYRRKQMLFTRYNSTFQVYCNRVRMMTVNHLAILFDMGTLES